MLSDSWIKKYFSNEDELERRRREAVIEEMGLEDGDIKKLQGQMLSPDEAVQAKQEEMTRIRQFKGRKENWLEFVDRQARMGRVLYGREFIRLLRQAIPQLRCADAPVRGQISLFAPVLCTYENGFHWGHRYVGWCQNDFNPEYEIDLTDKDGIATRQYRGWRTTLLNLLTARDGDGSWGLNNRMQIVRNGTGLPLNIVNEDQILKIFGYPTNGIIASNYRRQLWEFRNGRKTNPIVWT